MQLNFLRFLRRIKMTVIIGNLLIWAPILASLVVAHSNSRTHNVLDYSAVGDGNTDDTHAFRKAWKVACNASYSPATMVVPSQKKFFLQPVCFIGPCRSSSVTVEINGEIVAPAEPSEWKFSDGDNKTWIQFRNVNHLSVQGSGVIHGRGQKWWKLPVHNGPAALEITSSRDLRVTGLNFKDNPRMHLIINSSMSAYVSNITIDAPGDSPNTDGIHVTRTKYAIIDNCQISTGDDCISIVNGTSHLKVRNIICGPGHGISIGSLGKDGVEDKVEHVRVSNVVFRQTQNGVRIKTWQGGKGYAKHIKFERILSLDAQNPIIIDQYYCPHAICSEQDAAVAISHVSFRHITGTSSNKEAVQLECSDTLPCRYVTLEDIYILTTNKENAEVTCKNVRGRVHGMNIPHLEYCFS